MGGVLRKELIRRCIPFANLFQKNVALGGSLMEKRHHNCCLVETPFPQYPPSDYDTPLVDMYACFRGFPHYTNCGNNSCCVCGTVDVVFPAATIGTLVGLPSIPGSCGDGGQWSDSYSGETIQFVVGESQWAVVWDTGASWGSRQGMTWLGSMSPVSAGGNCHCHNLAAPRYSVDYGPTQCGCPYSECACTLIWTYGPSGSGGCQGGAAPCH